MGLMALLGKTVLGQVKKLMVRMSDSIPTKQAAKL